MGRPATQASDLCHLPYSQHTLNTSPLSSFAVLPWTLSSYLKMNIKMDTDEFLTQAEMDQRYPGGYVADRSHPDAIRCIRDHIILGARYGQEKLNQEMLKARGPDKRFSVAVDKLMRRRQEASAASNDHLAPPGSAISQGDVAMSNALESGSTEAAPQNDDEKENESEENEDGGNSYPSANSDGTEVWSRSMSRSDAHQDMTDYHLRWREAEARVRLAAEAAEASLRSFNRRQREFETHRERRSSRSPYNVVNDNNHAERQAQG